MPEDADLLRRTWRFRSGVILAGVAAFVAVSIWMYMPWWELALRSDRSPVSWLSSALLFACAVVALRTTATRAPIPATFSAWLAVAMFALALDEQFQFHEYWKFRCIDWFGWCAAPMEGHVDWLGDAPMVLVGLVGIATAMKLFRAIGNPAAKNLLLASLAVGILLALGTHFGHAGGLLPAWLGRFEEVYEVLAEALFLCALLEMSAPGDPDQVQSASSL